MWMPQAGAAVRLLEPADSLALELGQLPLYDPSEICYSPASVPDYPLSFGAAVYISALGA